MSETKNKPARVGRFELRCIDDHQFDEAASALMKMVRANKPYEAFYWSYVLHESGYYKYVWKRLAILASEDCSAAPEVAFLVHTLHSNYQAFVDSKNRADGLVFIAQAVIALCRSLKSREADSLACLVDEEYKRGARLETPEVAKDCHTAVGKALHGRWMDGSEEDIKERHRKWFDTWSRSTPELERDDQFLERLKAIYGL